VKKFILTSDFTLAQWAINEPQFAQLVLVVLPLFAEHGAPAANLAVNYTPPAIKLFVFLHVTKRKLLVAAAVAADDAHLLAKRIAMPNHVVCLDHFSATTARFHSHGALVLVVQLKSSKSHLLGAVLAHHQPFFTYGYVLRNVDASQLQPTP